MGDLSWQGRQEQDVNLGSWRREGNAQHSQGRVGVDREGGRARARFAQSHEDPVTDHCQDVCVADAFTPCLIFDVWHANLTLPVQLPVGR